MNSLDEELKRIEIEFGFRYMKKDIRGRVRDMVSTIHKIRKTNAIYEERLQQQKERIRELELQICDLDYKIRG
jgi:hypothetical protein